MGITHLGEHMIVASLALVLWGCHLLTYSSCSCTDKVFLTFLQNLCLLEYYPLVWGLCKRLKAKTMTTYGEGEKLVIPVGPARCPQFQSTHHLQPLSRDAHLGDKEEAGDRPAFLPSWSWARPFLGTATALSGPLLSVFCSHHKGIQKPGAKDPDGFLFFPLVCTEPSQDKHKE